MFETAEGLRVHFILSTAFELQLLVSVFGHGFTDIASDESCPELTFVILPPQWHDQVGFLQLDQDVFVGMTMAKMQAQGFDRHRRNFHHSFKNLSGS